MQDEPLDDEESLIASERRSSPSRASTPASPPPPLPSTRRTTRAKTTTSRPRRVVPKDPANPFVNLSPEMEDELDEEYIRRKSEDSVGFWDAYYRIREGDSDLRAPLARVNDFPVRLEPEDASVLRQVAGESAAAEGEDIVSQSMTRPRRAAPQPQSLAQPPPPPTPPPSPTPPPVEQKQKTSDLEDDDEIKPLKLSIEQEVTEPSVDMDEADSALDRDDLFAPNTMTPEQEQMYDLYSRALLELLDAKDDFESILDKYKSYIDEGFVSFVQGRLRSAERMGDQAAQRPLTLLAARLKVQLARQKGTASLNLLDDCLKICRPLIDRAKDSNAKREETADMERQLYDQVEFKLRQAFSGPTLPMDVFSLSLAVADRKVNVDELLGDLLTQETFLQDVGQFYNDTIAKRQSEYAYHLKIEEMARIEIPKIADKETRVKLATELIRKRRVFQEQFAALDQVARILELASGLEMM